MRDLGNPEKNYQRAIPSGQQKERLDGRLEGGGYRTFEFPASPEHHGRRAMTVSTTPPGDRWARSPEVLDREEFATRSGRRKAKRRGSVCSPVPSLEDTAPCSRKILMAYSIRIFLQYFLARFPRYPEGYENRRSDS